ncbi:shikimate dehydrogenase [Ectobacillus ponti]|uniref:Shikimate dehydrogenase (NADP(+)) n=1 Tax=Ectobacillus ponti TaxID=2961894 RepID=A0AA42BN14_9BACI|nr:shikimate dehydrogenase [Ectobacillus ponti]MCP8967197.1 shikimate dehydrogenase [Ectobacillus ponti]
MKKLYGVIGNPIGHSLSPLMHNDALSHLGIDAHYHAFRIKEEQLENAVKGFRAIEISGFNVTTPHKVDVMRYLDEVDELAGQIGAVNTVVNRNGALVGYNTDGIGYIRSLQSISKEPLQEKRILLLGAGGASRAIFFSLAALGVREADIANRTASRAQELIDACRYEIASKAITMEQAEAQQHEYDIIINTTTVGMSPHVADTPLPIRSLKRGAIVSDIIYNPFETRLLREAREAGAIVQNGVDMFVYQGALAFEYWTGQWPDVGRMKQTVITKLGG